MGLVDEQGYPHEGHLNFLDNQVDVHSGTIRARAVFDNADGEFTPGLFARIKLVGGTPRDTILIDERAVGTDLGKKFVLALKKDNTVEYRPVTLGAKIDGLRVVNQGLAVGDVIVVNGLQHVRPGSPVTPHARADGGRQQRSSRRSTPRDTTKTRDELSTARELPLSPREKVARTVARRASTAHAATHPHPPFGTFSLGRREEKARHESLPIFHFAPGLRRRACRR